MANTYSAGIVTAYGAAKKAGYTGTYEQFCADQANFARYAQQVREDKESVEQTVETFSETTVPAAVQSVTDEGDTQIDRVEAAGNSAVEAVGNAGTSAVGNVNQAGTDQVNAVNQAGATQAQAVEDKGDEVIASIPADYSDLTAEVDDLTSQLSDLVNDMDEYRYITQRPAYGLDFTSDGMSVQEDGPRIVLNGTNANALLLYADKREEIGYTHGNGFNTNFFSIYNPAHRLSVSQGHQYMAHFKMLSGSVTRGGVTYTSESQFSGNIIWGFLCKADATSSSRDILKFRTDTLFTMPYSEIGTLVFYIYTDLTANDAVFEFWLEDITLKNKATEENVSVVTDPINESLEEVKITTHDSFPNNIYLKPGYDKYDTDGLICELNGTRLRVNGVSTENKVIFLEDLDHPSGAYRVSNGFSQNFYNIYNPANRKSITPGHRYKVHFELLSGTLTRNGVTYDRLVDLPDDVNVVNLYLMNEDAAVSADYQFRIKSTAFYIPNNIEHVGTFGLYIYNNTTVDNAVFEIYIEDVTQDNLKFRDRLYGNRDDAFWLDEINTSVQTINSNIAAASEKEVTICFVTDCHWRANVKKSPGIAKRIMERCNINYFVNGGDLLESHLTDRQAAMDEIFDCVNAFKICPLPMFTLYGNHDRNRNNNTEEFYLSFAEHANLVFKSFLPKLGVTLVNNSYANFYWEDENYRYVGLYWYYSDSRSLDGIEEIVNTNKPLIIFCHGIYFTLNPEDRSSDVIDNGWIINAFAPYKEKIRCFIQGHTHVQGLRYAYDGLVPIVICPCDKSGTERGSLLEQGLTVLTIDQTAIKYVAVGRGIDVEITTDTPEFTTVWDEETGWFVKVDLP